MSSIPEKASKVLVEAFVGEKRLGFVGASGSGKGFGASAYKELKKNGYDLLPVHPRADSIQGDACLKTVADLPHDVGGLVVMVPPVETEKVVKEAKAAGIPRVWLQQGAQSDAALAFCADNDLPVIHGECILMFAKGSGGLHGFHRWLWSVFGKLPK